MCVSVHVCVHVCTCTHMPSTEFEVRSLFSVTFHIISTLALETTCLCPTQHGVMEMHTPLCFFFLNVCDGRPNAHLNSDPHTLTYQAISPVFSNHDCVHTSITIKIRQYSRKSSVNSTGELSMLMLLDDLRRSALAELRWDSSFLRLL